MNAFYLLWCHLWTWRNRLLCCLNSADIDQQKRTRKPGKSFLIDTSACQPNDRRGLTLAKGSHDVTGKGRKNRTDLSLPKQAGIHPVGYPAWSPSRSPCRLLMSSTKGCHLIPSWRCSIFRSACKSVRSAGKNEINQSVRAGVKSQSLCTTYKM